MSMPEKQRKQIEFIDDIYQKVVLKKKDKTMSTFSTSYNKQSTFQNDHDDKENNFKVQPNCNIDSLDSQNSQIEYIDNNNSYYDPKKSSYQKYCRDQDASFQSHKSKDRVTLPLDLSKSVNRSQVRSPQKNQQCDLTSSQNNHQFSTFSSIPPQNQSNIEETLRALSETASQLRQACIGINQFASMFLVQNNPLQPSDQAQPTRFLQESELQTPRE